MTTLASIALLLAMFVVAYTFVTESITTARHVIDRADEATKDDQPW